MNPAPSFPYIKTGEYALYDLDATYAFARRLEVSLGFKNVLDDYVLREDQNAVLNKRDAEVTDDGVPQTHAASP